jgi:uncharacterized damage-inducible protein DinB
VIEAAEGGNLAYSPDPKSKTGLALIQHIVNEDVWFLNSIADGTFGAPGDASGITSAAVGAAQYRDAAPAALERIRSLSDAQLAEAVDFFGMANLPRFVLLGIMVKHSVHHRGQLSTYLRAMGCKVPGIYGPSADTQ